MMNPNKQRKAIAEACGWIYVGDDPDRYPYYLAPKDDWRHSSPLDANLFPNAFPDYLGDLNAMHAALKAQNQAFRAEFDRLLRAMAEEKHLLVTELEAKDWSGCFIFCLQSQRDCGN